MDDSDRSRPRIVVVGPCASGKSTLVSRLNERGHDAHVVAQEHSDVRDLWKRKDPDVLVALEVDLTTVRERRTPEWPETIYERQHERLASAYDAADMVIDTGVHGPDEVVGMVQSLLADRERPD